MLEMKLLGIYILVNIYQSKDMQLIIIPSKVKDGFYFNSKRV